MIELQSISAGYGSEPVLNELCASIQSGQILTVVGPNGCGKSTLLKAIVGILPITVGEILLDGVRLTDQKRDEIARKISYLPQGKTVPDMTVRQMVLHGRFPHLSYPRRYGKRDHEIARLAMEKMNIYHLAEQPLSSLSGGMRQTAYIAMALAQDTDYILLDEPTTYLDIAHQLSLMKTLRMLADSGKGIVTVLHDLPLALSCSDRIAVMDTGNIRMIDTPEAVCASNVIPKTFGVSLQATPQGYFFICPKDMP